MDIKKSFKTLALCFCFIFTLSSIVPTYEDSKNDPQLSSSNSIQSGNYIYFAAGEKLYKVNTKTQKSTCILTMSDSFYLCDVNVYNGYIYFVQYKGGSGCSVPYIYRIKTNGTRLKRLAKGNNIQIYNNKIYFIRYNFYDDEEMTMINRGIYRMSTSGSNLTAIKSSSLIEKFFVKNNYIYFQSSDIYENNSVYRMSINGKNTTRLYYNKSSNIFDVSNVNLYDLIPTESGYSAYKYSFSKKSFSEILSCESAYCVRDAWIYYTVRENDYEYLYKFNLETKKKVLLAIANSISNVRVTSSNILFDRITDQSELNHNYIHTCITDLNGNKEKTIAKYYLP